MGSIYFKEVENEMTVLSGTSIIGHTLGKHQGSLLQWTHTCATPTQEPEAGDHLDPGVQVQPQLSRHSLKEKRTGKF